MLLFLLPWNRTFVTLRKKKGYTICLSSCFYFFLAYFLILLMNIFKNSWESLGGWVSKQFILTLCLFDRLACISHFQLQRFVLFLLSLQSGCWKYGCKLFSWFWTWNIYIYIYAYTCVFSGSFKDFSSWSMFWNFTRISLIMCFSFILYKCYWALSIWKSVFCNKKCSSVTF